ncbi:PREDICTED: mavicyanin-like [Fragaria vesca subsp. vesca]|uniref:mavicyanin-like n=1 Tax=Fragaria vesca subsp. vesca TaxID=101020 RepID=UPI0002C305E7|nr:PREDICTED: mavicyanin-like [Fragaria vesca subsp. vesca]
MEPSKVFVLLCLLSTLHFLVVSCVQFEVGGTNGWKVPKSKEEYNQWASKNRFKVDDTVHFNYSKDSVMVVTEEEYDKCKSERPIFYSKDGNTEYKLNRPGLFYFMSGVKGHCEKGQRMIIKVLEVEPASPPPQAATELQKKKNSAAGIAVSSATVVLCFVSFVAVFMF